MSFISYMSHNTTYFYVELDIRNLQTKISMTTVCNFVLTIDSLNESWLYEAKGLTDKGDTGTIRMPTMNMLVQI